MFARKALPVAMAAAGWLGFMGPAQAVIYGESSLEQKDLSIIILNEDNTPADITSFTFTLTNTGTLGTTDAIGTSSCTGSLTPVVSGTCGGFAGSGANTVLGGSTDISTGDSGPNLAEVPLGTRGGEDNYTFLGPTNTGEFGTGDSVIWDAALVGDPSTATSQIAEAQLQTGTNASATTTIQSVTGFTLDFEIAGTGPGLFIYEFDADVDLVALINDLDPNLVSATADASVSYSVELVYKTGPAGVGLLTWSPQGTATNDCLFLGAALACEELADSEDLNTNVNVSYPPNQIDDVYSTSNALHFNALITPDGSMLFPDLGMVPFGIIALLQPGEWSLTLSATTNTAVARAAVPEPGSLALLGLGLGALGTAVRRRKSRVV